MPTTDFDYHYRQAEIKDPFGHVWVFQKKIWLSGNLSCLRGRKAERASMEC
jgi:hypothetical protein